MAKTTKGFPGTFEKKCKAAGMTPSEIKTAVQIREFVHECRDAQMSPDEIKVAVLARYGKRKGNGKPQSPFRV